MLLQNSNYKNKTQQIIINCECYDHNLSYEAIFRTWNMQNIKNKKKNQKEIKIIKRKYKNMQQIR